MLYNSEWCTSSCIFCIPGWRYHNTQPVFFRPLRRIYPPSSTCIHIFKLNLPSLFAWRMARDAVTGLRQFMSMYLMTRRRRRAEGPASAETWNAAYQRDFQCHGTRGTIPPIGTCLMAESLGPSCGHHGTTECFIGIESSRMIAASRAD